MDIYFSDFFDVPPKRLESYGAFNIALINDLPLFVDPFLLFNSKKAAYRKLHDGIVEYLRFLRDKSAGPELDRGLIHAWYLFPEIRQNWLGFSRVGNKGAGLRDDFATALYQNLRAIFTDFGEEKVTKGSHLEKLCLISDGVGRDKISDFTTNLIKEFLLNYTQEFARAYLPRRHCREVVVGKVRFNYETETWERGVFDLPRYMDDYVILTPKDMLTKDELWINKDDLYREYESIPLAIPNDQLRAQINNYFRSILPRKPKSRDIHEAISLVIAKYPEILDYYIRHKEERGDQASNISTYKVREAERQYIDQIRHLSDILRNESGFYKAAGTTYKDALARVHFLKDVIENKDGYRLFYVQGEPIERENDLQIMYRLTWFAAESDVNREVNNGRGPVDFKVSRGSADATLVEFKLASNTQLERNLQHQVRIYEKASDTHQSINVILYYSARELRRVQRILDRLKISKNQGIVLIDARRDNKVSGSKA